MMCKFCQLVAAFLLSFVAGFACSSGAARAMVLERAGEGIVGGLLFGALSAADKKWFSPLPANGTFGEILGRELKVGLCAGFLVGCAVSAMTILGRWPGE